MANNDGRFPSLLDLARSPVEEDETTPPSSKSLLDFARQATEQYGFAGGSGVNLTPPDIGIGGAFAGGVKKGLLEPLTIFRGPEEEDPRRPEPDTLAEKGAEVTGFLLGMGVSAVPFVKGAGLALNSFKAVRALDPRVIRFLEGTVGFGAFEAGAAETVEEIPERVAIGTAFGAAFEGVLLARSIRSGGELATRLGSKKVDPDALALMQQLRPQAGHRPKRIIDELEAVGDHDAQMEFALAELGGLHNINGMSIIQVDDGAEALVSRIRERYPHWNFEIAQREAKQEILFFDPDPNTTRLVRIARPELKQIQEIMGSGRRLSYSEAAQFVRRTAPEEPRLGDAGVDLQDVDELGGVTFGEINLTYPESRGPLISIARRLNIDERTQINNPEVLKFGALVHEYTHALFSTGGPRAGLPRWRDDWLDSVTKVFDISGEQFDDLIPEEILMDIGNVGKSTGQLLAPTNLPPLYQELKRATVEVVELQLDAIKMRTSGTVEDKINQEWAQYWGKDGELIARLTELMALDPNKAREVAPRATELMLQAIKRETSKFDMLFTRTRTQGVEELLNARWRQLGSQREFFTEAPIKWSKKLARQWKQGKFVSGMGVEYRGKMYEATGVGRTVKGTVRLFDPRTKTSFAANVDEVVRPLLPNVARVSKAIDDEVVNLLSSRPDWTGILFRHPAGGVQRGIIELDRMLAVSSYPNFARENWGKIFGSRRPGDVEDLRASVNQWAKENGYTGILLEEAGVPKTALIFDQDVVIKGERLGDEVGLTLDNASVSIPDAEGNFDLLEVDLSWRNRVESLLRGEGIAERDIEYFMSRAEEKLAEQFGPLPDDIIENMRSVDDAVQSLDDLPTNAYQMGLRHEETLDGMSRLVDENYVELARSTSRSELSGFTFSTQRSAGAKALDGSGMVPTAVSPGREAPIGRPPRPQEQFPDALAQPGEGLSVAKRIANSLRLALSAITPAKQLFQAMESLGVGQAFTKIYEPTQAAFRKMHQELGNTARERLGGKTYTNIIDRIDKLQTGLSRERQGVVSRFFEFATKEELEQTLRINAAEKELARQISTRGLADDIPRLVRFNRFVNNFMMNEEKAVRQHLPEMLRLVREGKVDPQLPEMVRKLQQVAQKPTTREELLAQAGFSANERWVLDALDNVPEQVALLKVARYAPAPRLEPGYANGREMYEALHDLTGREKQIVREMDRVFEDIFDGTGFNREEMLAGFWPVMKKMIENGFTINDGVFAGMENGVAWAGRRVMTGSLDPYAYHPTLVTYKHVMNILGKRHLDPALETAFEELKYIRAADPRSGRLAAEYLAEVEGRPHKSFKALTELFRSVATALGTNIDERTGERFINTLTRLSYEATIPFRAGLVARNYFETIQKTVPIIGPQAWGKGVKRAITQEGFDEAVRAGAIDVATYPLFGSTEVFGVESARLAERLGPVVAQAGRRWEEVFNAGFTWYRKADDVGRAIAFHGQKARINEYLPRYLKGELEYDRFKELAKVKTFDDTIQRQFDELMGNGAYEEAANFLGKELADKAHFLYGNANHPIGWNGITGRLFGQFGTFPSQYVQYIGEGLGQGTVRDKAEFIFYHGASNVGVVALGASAFGLNLTSWAVWPSLQYTGGPYADMAMNVAMAVGGSEAEKSLAQRNLAYMFPSLDNPRSIFVPGSYFLADLKDAFEQNTLEKSFLEASGFQFLESQRDLPGWVQAFMP